MPTTALAKAAVLLCLLAATVTQQHTISGGKACKRVRFATYNTSLNRNKAGELLAELQSGVSEQASNVSAVLQSIRPDVLVLNEFDYYQRNAAVKAFQDNFLAVPQAPDLQPLRYPYVFTAPVNTGVPSGRDFDHDGRADGPADAFGYGLHPGQYGMVLLSQFPIDAARTFQHFLYKDMPGALLPTDPATSSPWYDAEDLEVLRLSSKSHWDVPIDIQVSPTTGASKRVHMLLHHPTPPAFDGKEGRNLLRNHDEIRLFADYLGCGLCTPKASAASADDSSSEDSTGVTAAAMDGGGGAAAYNTNSTTNSSSSSSSSCGDSHGVVAHLVCAARTKMVTWIKEKLPGLSWLHKMHMQHKQQKQERQQQQETLEQEFAELEAGPKQQQQKQQKQVQRQDTHPASYLYDDAGRTGGLDAGASFVIAGDHNADPLDGSAYKHAIQQLLGCCNITAEFTPVSDGGKEAGNKRPTDRTPPETKTSTFDLRVDYVLPSRDLKVVGGAVFWPAKAQQPQAGWIEASDHRPVYLDVDVCAGGGGGSSGDSGEAEAAAGVAEFVSGLDELVV